MKKTIIALLALGYTAAAAGVASEDFTFTTKDSAGKYYTVNLANEYDLTKDWTLTFDCISSPNTATTNWGTALISSEDDPTATYQHMQLYIKHSGSTKNNGQSNNDTGDNIINLKINERDDNRKVDNTLLDSNGSGKNVDLTGWDDTYFYGEPLTWTLSYKAEGGVLTLGISGLLNTQTWTDVKFDENKTLTQLKTGISDAQLEAKGFGDLPLWTLPSGTFSGTALNIPEPTTATLSLLALAGLAARRRRK